MNSEAKINGPLTNGLREQAGNWTLAADVNLLKCLKQFSENLVQRTVSLNNDLQNLEKDAVRSAIEIEHCFQTLDLIATKQFMENRVYDDDFTPEIPLQNNEDSQTNGPSEFLPKIKEALSVSLSAMKNPAVKTNHFSLPVLIGTREFIDSPTAGLVSPPLQKVIEGKQTNQIPTAERKEDTLITITAKPPSSSPSLHSLSSEITDHTASQTANVDVLSACPTENRVDSNESGDENDKVTENNVEEAAKEPVPIKHQDPFTDLQRELAARLQSAGSVQVKTNQDARPEAPALKPSLPTQKPETQPVKVNEKKADKPVAKKNHLFVDSESDDDLFSSSRNERPPPLPADLTDEDEDLFKPVSRKPSVVSKPKVRQPPTEESQASKQVTNARSLPKKPDVSSMQNQASQKPTALRSSLFGDSDSDDDLFGTPALPPSLKPAEQEKLSRCEPLPSAAKSNSITKAETATRKKASMLFSDDSDEDLFAGVKTSLAKPQGSVLQKKTENRPVVTAKEDTENSRNEGPQKDVGPSASSEKQDPTKLPWKPAGAVNMFGNVDPSKLLGGLKSQGNETNPSAKDIVPHAEEEAAKDTQKETSKTVTAAVKISSGLFSDDSDDDLFAGVKAAPKIQGNQSKAPHPAAGSSRQEPLTNPASSSDKLKAPEPPSAIAGKQNLDLERPLETAKPDLASSKATQPEGKSTEAEKASPVPAKTQEVSGCAGGKETKSLNRNLKAGNASLFFNDDSDDDLFSSVKKIPDRKVPALQKVVEVKPEAPPVAEKSDSAKNLQTISPVDVQTERPSVETADILDRSAAVIGNETPVAKEKVNSSEDKSAGFKEDSVTKKDPGIILGSQASGSKEVVEDAQVNEDIVSVHGSSESGKQEPLTTLEKSGEPPTEQETEKVIDNEPVGSKSAMKNTIASIGSQLALGMARKPVGGVSIFGSLDSGKMARNTAPGKNGENLAADEVAEKTEKKEKIDEKQEKAEKNDKKEEDYLSCLGKARPRIQHKRKPPSRNHRQSRVLGQAGDSNLETEDTNGLQSVSITPPEASPDINSTSAAIKTIDSFAELLSETVPVLPGPRKDRSAATEAEEKANQPNPAAKASANLFDDSSDSEGDLFTAPPAVKKVPEKPKDAEKPEKATEKTDTIKPASLFSADSDSDDDLFSSSIKKPGPPPLPDSLFLSDDEDDDLFSSKVKGKAGDRSSSSAIKSDSVLYDPLCGTRDGQ